MGHGAGRGGDGLQRHDENTTRQDRRRADLTHTEKVAEGTFEDGALRLQVEFLIDTASGGLVCVTYATMDAAQNRLLRETLIKRYGRPMGGSAQPARSTSWDGESPTRSTTRRFPARLPASSIARVAGRWASRCR